MKPIDTESFYAESCAKGFVKLEAVARNKAWVTQTAWGPLEITVNLSKPEKDPRDIAAAAQAPAQPTPTQAPGGPASGNVPQYKDAKSQGRADSGASAPASYIDPATGFLRPCPLCVRQDDLDVGYARKLSLRNEPWGLWFSPYAYYVQHCIAMSWQHRPMHIDRAALACLFDAVDALPGYFFGSNADLPIVGGSILSHDHFQGGAHIFPMQLAPLDQRFQIAGFTDMQSGVVKWPLSVIRLQGESRERLVDAACAVLDAWCVYDDEQAGIVSGIASGARDATPAPGAAREAGQAKATSLTSSRHASDGTLAKVHNTITPILRKDNGVYQLDLALRCNITSAEHPLGVFHPHERLHHIKKENIGLIEVMGLAILPPRVLNVMSEQHLSQDDVGNLFAEVLECAGVFKWDASGRAAQQRFLDSLA